MQIHAQREIEKNPKPEDVGIIKLHVLVVDEYKHLTFSTSCLVKDFTDRETNECDSRKDLSGFLRDAGLNNYDMIHGMTSIFYYVITCSTDGDYSPEYALEIRVEMVREDDDDDDEDGDEDGDENDDAGIEEALQDSFEETSNTRSEPACKHVVNSLPRKIYNKKINLDKHTSSEVCTICLEEFKNGGKFVTLPCGHEFDEDCIMKWFETSHVCPLCRYKFPCEDQ